MEEIKASDSSDLKTIARNAPESPGVYIMRDDAGVIIYVGKAKILKNRLSSYFTGRKDPKTRLLVSKIARLEWILTETEYEALLLENELIKRNAPKYNINLKDGKTYPVIRITAEEWPRVFRTRRIVDDGSLYFGPFPSAEIIDAYLDLIRRFPLRRCRRMGKRDAPCMYYHIGRCPAPCAGKISPAGYAEIVERVRKLLAGETEKLLGSLRSQMEEAAATLRFEDAARLRDAIAAIEAFRGESRVVDFDPESRDYVAFALDGSLATFTVFAMRGGRLAGGTKTGPGLRTERKPIWTSHTFYTPERMPPPRASSASRRYGTAAEYFRKELVPTAEFRRADDEEPNRPGDAELTPGGISRNGEESRGRGIPGGTPPRPGLETQPSA
jgi:excinuclease ABC subunit C